MMRFRVKEGWDRVGEEGNLYRVEEINGRNWALVLFDGDEDPDLYKVESLEHQEIVWHPLEQSIK